MTGWADCRWVKSGHHRIRMRERLLGQRELQVEEPAVERVDRIAHPETKIERHLVVARTRRVQPPRRLADDLGQPGFDVHVDVFERLLEGERSRLDFARDLG